MSVKSAIGLAAAILVLLAAIPYTRSIVRGETHPSRISWGIWSALGLLLLTSYWASGALETLWFAAAYFLVPLTIFILSLGRGDSESSVLDIVCLAGAVCGIAIWAVSRSAVLALFAFLAADALGAIPTLRKSYLNPYSENLLAWTLGFGAAALNLLAVRDWTAQIGAYPLYAFVSTGSICLTIITRRVVGKSGSPEAAL